MSDENKTEPKETAKIDDKLAAKIKGIEQKLNKLGTWLEQKMGVDIDNDGKVGKFTAIALLAVFGAMTVQAETVRFPIFDGTYGTCIVTGNSTTASATMRVNTLAADTVSGSGNLTVGGKLDVSGGANVAGGMTGVNVTATGKLLVSGGANFGGGVTGVNVTATGKLLVSGGASIEGGITNGALTASQLVLTDANKQLVSSATLPADSVDKAALSAVDYGDFTAGSDGTVAIDDNAVAASEVGAGVLASDVLVTNANIAVESVAANQMKNADHGDVTWATGVASIDDNAVLASEVGAGVLASDVLVTNANIAAESVGASAMANADHGDITWASGVASVDDNAVLASEVGAGVLASDALVTNANYAEESITSTKFTAADWGDVTVDAAGAVTVDDNAVAASEIGAGILASDALVTNANLAAECITSGKISIADVANIRNTLDLEVGTDVQAYDADLTTWAGVTSSANGRSLVSAADYAAMKALLDLEIGTDIPAKGISGTWTPGTNGTCTFTDGVVTTFANGTP